MQNILLESWGGDGPSGKDTCCHAPWSEFSRRDPRVRRRKLIPSSCLLTFTRVAVHMRAPIRLMNE